MCSHAESLRISTNGLVPGLVEGDEQLDRHVVTYQVEAQHDPELRMPDEKNQEHRPWICECGLAVWNYNVFLFLPANLCFVRSRHSRCCESVTCCNRNFKFSPSIQPAEHTCIDILLTCACNHTTESDVLAVPGHRMKSDCLPRRTGCESWTSWLQVQETWRCRSRLHRAIADNSDWLKLFGGSSLKKGYNSRIL